MKDQRIAGKWVGPSFTAGLIATAQDVSLPVFQSLLEQGYTDYTVSCSPSATDGICIAGGGDTGAVADMADASRWQYAAPIFESRHVGCKCQWIVSGGGLPEVAVSAFGIQ